MIYVWYWGKDVPSMLSSINTQLPRRLSVGVLPEEPHIVSVGFELFVDIRWEVVALVDYSTDSVGR